MQEDGAEYSGFREENLARMAKVPERHLFEGPTIEVVTSRGQKLTAKSQFYPATFSHEDGKFEPLLATASSKDGYFLTMSVLDEFGREVGLRIAKINCPVNSLGWKVQTKVMIKDRGKGYAKPVDSAFVATLQWLADAFQSPVTWEIFNENAVKLESYRKSELSDPSKLHALEREQERWQALYGEGGYFGVRDNKKTFIPKSKETPDSLVVDLNSRITEALENK